MTQQEISYHVNRKHKDTVFRDLFGTEERKDNALSLYNALRGKTYTDPSVIEFTTLKNVLYLGVKNDISFIVGEEMELWEHQSTHNPNMPLRALSYFSHLYRKWIEKNGFSVYSEVAIPIPRPRYVVFYFGEDERPEKEVMRLSDAFKGESTGDPDALEVTAVVYNMNVGKNKEIASACEALAQYAQFIAMIRQGVDEGMPMEEAVDWAIERCIAAGILADYLALRRAEVKDILLTEYDEADTIRRLKKQYKEHYSKVGVEEGRKEGRKEGLQEGLQEGRKEGLREGRADMRESFLVRAVDAVRSGSVTLADAAALFGFDVGEIEARLGA